VFHLVKGRSLILDRESETISKAPISIGRDSVHTIFWPLYYRKDFSGLLACRQTSLLLEKDLIICAAESPFYTRLSARAGVSGNHSLRAAVKKSERFGSARGSSGGRAGAPSDWGPTVGSRYRLPRADPTRSDFSRRSVGIITEYAGAGD